MTGVFKRRSVFLAAGVLAVGVLVNVASATHSWGGYHWARTANPFTLKLGDNTTSSDWSSHLAQTSKDWNAGTIQNPLTPSIPPPSPVITAVVPGQSTKRCSMVAGTTQVCNANYGFNGWLGLATISISGGTHITQGSAKMNDSYFNTSTYNNPNEREHVMCQEVAHTFGLDHQSTDGSSQNSCMDYFSNTGANAGSTLSTKPNAHDFQELGIIYQHLDTTTTVAATPSSKPSASNDASDEPNNWGMLVSQSANGRSSTYEAHNQDGSKNVTHVYWTLEAAAKCAGCDHR
ncbi:MAG TPA: hypothetical protein VMZ52_06085, partial [Bryobacteraceae bacterium]|nr:hypothetical protein [Bryobacteraceae bacterium]